MNRLEHALGVLSPKRAAARANHRAAVKWSCDCGSGGISRRGLPSHCPRCGGQVQALRGASPDYLRQVVAEQRDIDRIGRAVGHQIAREFAHLPRMELHVGDDGKKILARLVRGDK